MSDFPAETRDKHLIIAAQHMSLTSFSLFAISH